MLSIFSERRPHLKGIETEPLDSDNRDVSPLKEDPT